MHQYMKSTWNKDPNRDTIQTGWNSKSLNLVIYNPAWCFFIGFSWIFLELILLTNTIQNKDSNKALHLKFEFYLIMTKVSSINKCWEYQLYQHCCKKQVKCCKCHQVSNTLEKRKICRKHSANYLYVYCCWYMYICKGYNPKTAYER